MKSDVMIEGRTQDESHARTDKLEEIFCLGGHHVWNRGKEKIVVQTNGALGASNRQPYPIIREGRPIEILLQREAMRW
jgi:hypothetical protein